MSGHSAAVRALAQDAALLEVKAALDRTAVPMIVLKGRATADLLGTVGSRLSADVDLLVPPDRYEQAQALMTSLGFDDVEVGSRARERCTYESTWRRGAVTVDLHRTLADVPDAQTVWDVFSEQPDELLVAGQRVSCGSRPVRLCHIVLHAAQSWGLPSAERTRDDLRVALESLPIELFGRASTVADRLGTGDLFEAALTRSGGDHVVRELGLARRSRTTRAQAVLTGRSTSRRTAETVLALPWRERPAAVLRLLAPSRHRLAGHVPAARHSQRAIIVAYVLRLRFGVRGLVEAVRRTR